MANILSPVNRRDFFSAALCLLFATKLPLVVADEIDEVSSNPTTTQKPQEPIPNFNIKVV